MFKANFEANDYMMRKVIKKYGIYAALRFCKNLGIEFEETYYMMFGRLPTKYTIY